MDNERKSALDAVSGRPSHIDVLTVVASVRAMYRLQQGCAAVREQRDQTRHPEYAKPELLAVTPNRVWS